MIFDIKRKFTSLASRKVPQECHQCGQSCRRESFECRLVKTVWKSSFKVIDLKQFALRSGERCIHRRHLQRKTCKHNIGANCFQSRADVAVSAVTAKASKCRLDQRDLPQSGAFSADFCSLQDAFIVSNPLSVFAFVSSGTLHPYSSQFLLSSDFPCFHLRVVSDNFSSLSE